MSSIDNIMALAEELAASKGLREYAVCEKALRAAIEQALAGGDHSADSHQPGADSHQPQPKQEPVAWLYDFSVSDSDEPIRDWVSTKREEVFDPRNGYFNIRPLYTTPQPEKKNATEVASLGESDASARLSLAKQDSTCQHEFQLDARSGIRICKHCCRMERRTAPQQRELVGLSNEEIEAIEDDRSLETTYDLVRAIEAKLRERNGGRA